MSSSFIIFISLFNRSLSYILIVVHLYFRVYTFTALNLCIVFAALSYHWLASLFVVFTCCFPLIRFKRHAIALGRLCDNVFTYYESPTVPQRVALSVVGSGVPGRCVLRALRKRRRLRVQEIINQCAQWPFMVIINV